MAQSSEDTEFSDNLREFRKAYPHVPSGPAEHDVSLDLTTSPRGVSKQITGPRV